jgi:hypothetical protein
MTFAGQASVQMTMERYGHLFPTPDHQHHGAGRATGVQLIITFENPLGGLLLSSYRENLNR